MRVISLMVSLSMPSGTIPVCIANSVRYANAVVTSGYRPTVPTPTRSATDRSTDPPAAAASRSASLAAEIISVQAADKCCHSVSL